MLPLLLVFAQAADGKAPADPMGLNLLLIPALLLLFYFVVILPMQRRQKQEEADKLNSLEKDDEILTIAGIYGTIASVNAEKDEIVVKVSDNTRLRMTRNAIHRNLTHEERLKAKAAAGTDAKAQGPTTSGQIRKA